MMVIIVDIIVNGCRSSCRTIICAAAACARLWFSSTAPAAFLHLLEEEGLSCHHGGGVGVRP